MSGARRRWRGRTMIGVAAVHTLFALVVLRGALWALVEHGVFNSVGDDPMRNAVVWFVAFGGAIALLGQAVDRLEQRAEAPPRSLGLWLLAMTAFGIVLMPASGWWLLLPPALSLSVASRGAEAEPHS